MLVLEKLLNEQELGVRFKGGRLESFGVGFAEFKGCPCVKIATKAIF